MLSWFKKIEAEFVKLFKKLPSWDATASSVIQVIAPIAEALLTGLDPALALVVNPIITKVEQDIATASVLIKQGAATPTLTGILNDAKTNLASILTLAEVKNSASAAKITNDVNLIIGEIEAILAALPASAASAPTSAPSPAPAAVAPAVAKI